MPGLESFMNGGLFDVIIPEGGTENKTLAAYDSCFEDGLQSAYLGDEGLFFFQYMPLYLANATEQTNRYAPLGFEFTVNDTYAMQSLCACDFA